MTTRTRPEKDLVWMAEEVTKPTLSRGAVAIDDCWKGEGQLERVGFLRMRPLKATHTPVDGPMPTYIQAA